VSETSAQGTVTYGYAIRDVAILVSLC